MIANGTTVAYFHHAACAACGRDPCLLSCQPDHPPMDGEEAWRVEPIRIPWYYNRNLGLECDNRLPGVACRCSSQYVELPGFKGAWAQTWPGLGAHAFNGKRSRETEWRIEIPGYLSASGWAADQAHAEREVEDVLERVSRKRAPIVAKIRVIDEPFLKPGAGSAWLAVVSAGGKSKVVHGGAKTRASAYHAAVKAVLDSLFLQSVIKFGVEKKGRTHVEDALLGTVMEKHRSTEESQAIAGLARFHIVRVISLRSMGLAEAPAS